MQRRAAARGFTLIELSIVLVIIGLVISGIMVGRDLTAAAQLRSVVSQYEQYKTAVQTFRTKYNCLPGDCPHASDFGFTPAYTYVTANGDGNGQVNWSSVVGDKGEGYHFWSQLAAANLIASFPPTLSVEHAQVPASMSGGRYPSSGGWWIYYLPELLVYAGPALLSQGMAGHGFGITAFIYGAHQDIIAPLTAYQIDRKVDDGFPASGSVRAGPLGLDGTIGYVTDYNNTPTCGSYVGGGTGNPTGYNLSNTAYSCSLVLQAGF